MVNHQFEDLEMVKNERTVDEEWFALFFFVAKQSPEDEKGKRVMNDMIDDVLMWFSSRHKRFQDTHR